MLLNFYLNSLIFIKLYIFIGAIVAFNVGGCLFCSFLLTQAVILLSVIICAIIEKEIKKCKEYSINICTLRVM